MSTNIAVLVPIAGLIPSTFEGQKPVFQELLKKLKRLADGKKVAVLSSSSQPSISYASNIATHFKADVSTCEGLLCDPQGDITDGCDCVDDFLTREFGLAIVVVASDIAPQFAQALSKQVGRPIRGQTDTSVYII
jgi:ABC-type Zn uptake system ZnuABC Zn-binding protein ZnuA